MEKSELSLWPQLVGQRKGDRMKNRYVILCISTIALFFFGFLYAWSIFKTAMLPDLKWDASRVSLAYTIAMVAFAIGNLLVGILPVKKHRTMCFLVAVSTVFAGSGMMLCSVIHHIWQLYLFYGIMFGFGVGILYNAWISMNMKWFADKGGFATGVLLMGFGVTSFVFSFFADTFFGREAKLGWRGSFLVLGLLLITIGLIALPFYRQATENQEKKAQRVSLTPGKMIRQKSFWAYTIWKMAFMLVGISVAGYATTIAVVLFLNQNPAETMETINEVMVETALGSGTVLKVAAIGGSLFSVGNGFGRIPIGMIHDKIGVNKTLFMICGIELAGAILEIVAFRNMSFLLLAVGLFLLGVGYGGVATEGPAFMSEMYGTRHVRANMGINAVTTIPMILIGSRIISSVYEKTGGFERFFLITIGLGIMASAAALCIPICIRNQTKENAQI